MNPTNMGVHYSSSGAPWETPPHIYKRLDDIFHFTTDVCATEENAKCEDFITPEEDAFTYQWLGTCWLNPPYGSKDAEYGLFPLSLLEFSAFIIENLTTIVDIWRNLAASKCTLARYLGEFQSHNSLLPLGEEKWKNFLQNFCSLLPLHSPSMGNALIVLARTLDSKCTNTKSVIEKLNSRFMNHLDLKGKPIGRRPRRLSTGSIAGFLSYVYTSLSINNASTPDYDIVIHDLIVPPMGGFIKKCLNANSGINKWVNKAYIESITSQSTVVCLLPARTDTKWFATCWDAKALIFIKGRLKFVGAKAPAPFPSCIAVFAPKLPADFMTLSDMGRIIVPQPEGVLGQLAVPEALKKKKGMIHRTLQWLRSR